MKALFAALLFATAAACAPSVSTPGASAENDECHASQYQFLLGKNKTSIPVTPAGETWRVTCTNCPVTMDYAPRRMNIFFDEATGVIKQVKCG